MQALLANVNFRRLWISQVVLALGGELHLLYHGVHQGPFFLPAAYHDYVRPQRRQGVAHGREFFGRPPAHRIARARVEGNKRPAGLRNYSVHLVQVGPCYRQARLKCGRRGTNQGDHLEIA